MKIQDKSFKFSKQLVKIYSQEEVQASINNEISVFLSEIASTTDKLPFLYQRLFKLEPVEGGYLYFKRSSKLITLNWPTITGLREGLPTLPLRQKRVLE